MQIVLVDRQKSLIDEWAKVFSGIDSVTIRHDSVFEMSCDALVSPANSFGFMDGGLDWAISEFFGWHVQKRLQQIIQAKYHGELLVGMAEIVPTDHHKIPYVISAPTMRVPMILGKESVNVYLATRAVLLLVKYGQFSDGTAINQKVRTVAMTGMGAGVGQVPIEICARQMRQAYTDVNENYQSPQSWSEAQMRHQLLYSETYRDLQY